MQIVTPRGEAAFAFVFDPQPAMQEGKPDQYALTLIWEDTPKLDKLKDAIVKVAEKKWGNKAKAMLDKGQLRSPLRPGEDKENVADYADTWEGKVFLTARGTDKPQVVGEDLEPLMDKLDFYSGCEARMDIYLFPYDKAGNKGVGAILNSAQKLGDGERKSGRRPAAAAFGDLDEEDEELM